MSIHWRDLSAEGRIEAIKTVYEPGMSASEIAARIGGITRNAIIGMYGRHRHLKTECSLRPFRTCTRSRKGEAKPRRKPVNLDALVRFVKPEPVERIDIPEAHLCGQPLVRVHKGQCWWPVNEAERNELHLFCGQPTEATYCAHHVSRAYREAS